MAIFEYLEILLFTIIPIIIILCVWRKSNGEKTSFLPTNWPLVGMLPSFLQNRHRMQDYFTEILSECGGTFQMRFPRIFNMDMLITSDPSNIDHIFSKNFANYPKGRQFREIFDILGDSIFNVDDELWEFQRRTTHSFMTGPEFNSLLESVVWQKVENGLLPVLDYFLQGDIDFDMQDIFQRFTYDSICKLALDFDPGSLCVDLPFIPSMQAFCDSIGAVFYRHTLPEFVWKLQRRLQIGTERKLLEARKVVDKFIYPLVNNNNITEDDDHRRLNLLTAFRRAYKEKSVSSLLLLGGNGGGGGGASSRETKFMRDTVLGLMFAGRDTSASCLTWLFWLIAKNPRTKTLILDEIENVLMHLKGEGGEGRINWSLFTVKESRKLIYLHGAMCESLRLYPPGPLEHKSPMKSDNLPSGHYIKENDKVILSFYSIGRTESVWGKDCLEFKPERWISTTSSTAIIKHVPSYKFPAFNVGPRTCLGKEMAFFEMKMAAAAIIYHYNIHLVENHEVSPRHDSVLLEMKHGLKVKLSKRNF